MSITRRDFLVGSAAVPAALVGISALGGTTAQGTAGWKLPEKRPFKTIENQWIPMKDGTQLAVRLWIPEGAERTHVPVVMEYIPYRKRDGTRLRDDPHGQYLAEHGIAFARVEIRGSGDSKGGLLLGEYMPHEQTDGLAAIGWLAKQPWCNGSVGMRGISWGGFNSLQIAALAPPELKAIMPMCFSDNRYTDDAHYVGGALGLVNFEWGTMFQAVFAGPPDPQIFGDGWKEEWMKRLEGQPSVLAEWLGHQRFDAYWQRQSVGLNYGAVKCPVYCVGGWEDGYNNSIERALKELKVPRKGLIGPWAHHYPPTAAPGPGLEWVVEEVRWWEQWLRGVNTGIMDEPLFRFYMPDAKAAQVFPHDTPGRWLAEDVWPSPRVTPHVFHLNSDGLSPNAGPEKPMTYKADKVVGIQRMEWVPFDMKNDLAMEQTPDDRNSVVFDSKPLDSDLEIIGIPVAKIRVAADVPIAQLAVRLNEVTSDGKSWQVTYGLLNLTHRESHEHPTPLVPGTAYDVTIALNMMAHRFKKGSRIRVALSESLWPLVWPSPQTVTLTLTNGVSTLSLPVRPSKLPEAAFTIPLIRDAELSHPVTKAKLKIAGPDATGHVTIDRTWPNEKRVIEATKTTVSDGWRNWHMEIRANQPNSSVWQGDFARSFDRPDWGSSLVVGSYELTSTTDSFHIKESIHVTHKNQTLFERKWDHIIKRDLM